MKSIDFSKGERGKYAKMNLRVIGDKKENSETGWAICLTNKSETLIFLKLYQIKIFPELKEIEVFNENGEKIICPQNYFLLLDLMKKDVDLLNSVSI